MIDSPYTEASWELTLKALQEAKQMEALEAIEFIVRGARGPMRPDEVFANARHLVINHDPLTREEMDQIILDHPRHFRIDEQGVITIHPERLKADKQVFQERILRLRGMLKVFPFTDHAELFEVVLIYAMAMRKPGQHAALLQPSIPGLDPIIADLAKEFPDQMRGISLLLESGGASLGVRLTSQLIHLSFIKLEPWEYVQIMRNAVADRATTQFTTPWSIGALMAGLLGDEAKDVFDPSADSGVLALTMAISASKRNSLSGTGLFLNRYARLLSTLQVRLLGTPFTSFEGSSMDEYDSLPEQVDHCISIPPFGTRMREQMGFARDGQPLFAVGSHELAINQIIKRLSPHGRAVILVPESMLFSQANTALRRRLIMEGSLQLVISLPAVAFAPHSKVKSNILVLDKSASESSIITFIDAAAYFNGSESQEQLVDVARFMRDLNTSSTDLLSASVPVDEVLKDDHLQLTVQRYVLPPFRAEETSTDLFGPLVDLGELITSVNASKGAPANIPYIQVAELAAHAMDLVRTAQHGRSDRPPSAGNAKLLSEEALLIARVGGLLKPTLFDASEGPVAIGSNVLAFKVHTDQVDPRYLALELRSGFIQEQISNYVKGTGIPSIAKADLLRLAVRLPDKAEQLRIVSEQYDLGSFMDRLRKSAAPLASEDLDHLSELVIKNAKAIGAPGLKKVLLDWMLHEQKLTEQRVLGTAQENMKMLRHQLNNRLSWVTTGMGNIKLFINGLMDSDIIPRDIAIAPSLKDGKRPVNYLPDRAPILLMAASAVAGAH